MASYTTDPNTSILIPVPGVDGGIGTAPIGYDYATLVSDALTVLAGLTHTGAPTDGKQIPTAGMNINANLSFNNLDATNVNAVRFTNNTATLISSSDINEFYVVNGNVYFNNAAGTPVQITSGSSIYNPTSILNLAYASTSVSSNHTILPADPYSFYNINTGSTLTITLPAAVSTAIGTYYIFKDSTGGASVHNVTINKSTGSSDTIDGYASYTINTNYGCIVMVCDGTSKWMVESIEAVALNGNPISLAAPTAGQVLIENAAATGSAWTTVSGGDGYFSTTTPGMLTNTGINGITVPAGPSANTVLVATSGTAATWEQINSNQISSLNVSKLNAGNIGQILGNNTSPIPTWITVSGDASIGATGVATIASAQSGTITFSSGGTVSFASNVGAPTITQASTSIANGTTFTISGQQATGSGSIGGNISINSGSGVSNYGTISLISENSSLGVSSSKLSVNTALTYTNLKSVSGNYTVNSVPIHAGLNDYIILCNSTSGLFIVTLPVSPSTGDTYIIKDAVGKAATNNIIINGGSINIDGSSETAIQANYGVIRIIYNGTMWNTI